MTMPQRLAILLLGVFLAGAVAAIVIPTSPSGAECGTWLTPEWTDAETAEMLNGLGANYDTARGIGADNLANDAASLASNVARSKLLCDDALGTRRTATIVMLGLAAVVPFGVVFVAGRAATEK